MSWLSCICYCQQRVAIKTKGLSLKTTACELLLFYFDNFKEKCGEFAEVVSACITNVSVVAATTFCIDTYLFAILNYKNFLRKLS